MNAMIWETAGGEWDVIVVGKGGVATRLTCHKTEAEATEIIRDLGWNLMSIVRLL